MAERLENIKGLLMALCFAVLVLVCVNTVQADIASGTYDDVDWVITDAGELIIGDGTEQTFTYRDERDYDSYPWYAYRLQITSVRFNGTVNGNGSVKKMFFRCPNLTNLDVSGFKTNNVTDMSYMFTECSNITSLDVSNFNTSSVTDMNHMFSECSGLQNLAISNFNTDSVTNMKGMFLDCFDLTTLDLSNFNTSNVTNMNDMFGYCTHLTSLNVSNFDTENVTDMSCMFRDCSSLTSLDLSNFNTNNVTDMNRMFYHCSSLKRLNVSNFNTTNVTNMSYMFAGCSILFSIDVSSFNTSNVTDMSWMFSECTSLRILDLSNFDTANVTNMQQMFYNSGASDLTRLNISGFDTRNVTNMRKMFYNCHNLTNLDVSKFDTSNVTDMCQMFYNCSNPSLTNLDVSGFDTSNVTDMTQMFEYCTNITNLDVSGFDTSNVTGMSGMFDNCSKLVDIDVSQFDTNNVTNMSYMFDNCVKLTNLDVSGFETNNVTDMSYMFAECQRLTTLDVSEFDTNNVTTMYKMFYNCTSLTSLNLSNFNTGSVTDMTDMFTNCSMLQSVEIGESFNFSGGGITDDSKKAILPTPQPTRGVYYTGNWINEDIEISLLPTELRDQYNGTTMSGVWTWELEDNSAVIIFDTCGGYMETTRIEQTTPSTITMPSAIRFRYLFSEWNTKSDGTGMAYNTGNTYTPVAGKTTMFYAQWEDAPSYTVTHMQQNITFDGYDVIKIETLYSDHNQQGNPEPKTYTGYHFANSEPSLPVTVASDNSTTVTMYYDRDIYTIHYNSNNAEGTMPDQTLSYGLATKLLDNRFKYTNHWFSGWNTQPDGSGISYSDAQTVSNLAEHNETFNLYAQWIPFSNSIETSEGKITVQVKAGETITLPNLPAGINYDIVEINNPNGWTQTETVLDTGTIVSSKTTKGVIRNKYSASGIIQLAAYKTMQNEEPEIDAYSFELLQGNEVLQTKTNGKPDLQEEIQIEDNTINNPYFGLSKIIFDDISFTQAGDYTYTIREIQGNKEDIDYDTHTETVIVHVTDNLDGTLTCTAEYDTDGPVFTNKRIPVFEHPEKKGDLQISKTVSNTTTDTLFDFVITLKDQAGTELTDIYEYSIGEETRTITSGQTVQLGAEQTLTIHNIPEDTEYTVEELPKAGYEQVSADNTSGIITEDITKEASFVNVYTANGDGQIQLTKRMIGSALSGGEYTFELMDTDGRVIQTTTNNASGEIVFNPISYTNADIGNRYRYTVREVTGTDTDIEYDTHIAEIIIDIKDNTDGTINPEISYDNGEFVNKKYYDIPFSKKDLHGIKIAGAQLAVTGIVDNQDITPITWTSDQSVHIAKLTVGTYTLSEIAVPDDSIYGKADDIQFTINNDGTISINNESIAEIVMTDPYIPHDITISKKDENGNYVSGAVLQITGRETGAFEDITPITWTTDNTDKSVSIKPGTYILHEVSLPDNCTYKLADDIEFVISDTGQIIIDETPANGIVMTDPYCRTTVTVSKINPDGEEIANVVLELTGRENGASEDINPITWITGTDGKENNAYKPHELTLLPGSYTLHETECPPDYIKAEDISFTIDNTGVIRIGEEEVTGIIMEDTYTVCDLSVSKTVRGNMSDLTDDFMFSLTLERENPLTETVTVHKSWKDSKYTEEIECEPDEHGTIRFALAHNEIATINGIRYGTVYSVVEDDYTEKSYSVEHTENASGTITSDTNIQFWNTRNMALRIGIDMGNIIAGIILISLSAVPLLMFFRQKRRF